MQLTIEIGPDMSDKLKNLEERINSLPSTAIKRVLDHRVSAEEIAGALVEMGLVFGFSGTSTEKDVYMVMAFIVGRQKEAMRKNQRG